MTNNIKTGFKKLDNLLDGGLKKDSLNLLCSRPGIGKTTFALNVINANANTKSIAYFNYELSKDELLKRMNNLFEIDCSNKNISVYKYDYDKTIEDIINKCIELKKSTTGLDLVIIDYIELISCKINIVRKKDFNSYIINELYNLAQEYNISLLVLSQLPKTEKELTINDLYLDKMSLDNLENVFYLNNDSGNNELKIFRLNETSTFNINIELNNY